MVDYKQILRLRAEGVSQRGIADVLGCSRNTVAAVFAAANAAGVGFGEVGGGGGGGGENTLPSPPPHKHPPATCCCPNRPRPSLAG
jgi:hypothetical protein